MSEPNQPHFIMPTIQVYDVKFDTTDEGIEQLSSQEITTLEEEIEGQIFEIDCHPDADIAEFEYLICEEITIEDNIHLKEDN